MKLTKITVENFKSIKNIEFDIKKYGSSYTTMLLGVNESGKSNVLEAMSFFNAPGEDFDYYSYHNQKDENYEPVDLWFSLAFENDEKYVEELRENIEDGELLKFEINNIVKNVYLLHDEKNFKESYDFDVKSITKGLYAEKTKKNVTNTAGQTTIVDSFKVSKTKDSDASQELNAKLFKELFSSRIIKIISRYEPSVTFWKPSKEYLISTEDLHKFALDIDSKPALKNIFLLAGYDSDAVIKDVVSTISNGHLRSKLESKLEDELDKYIKMVWKHDIDAVIDITETGQFTLSIKDTGEENKHDRLSIDGRSEGARHFLSLILSLSIESKHEQRKNQLILIDEPEAHLHPSGIRDLRNELLRIGKDNYLFVSTHSPFLVDKDKKERNIIIKKNGSALTEKILIESHANIIDDEVLQDAFGLDVYKDLLNPHSILVEGASDKVILQKVLKLKEKEGFGITNGHGSNIDTLAAKLNYADISILVIVDDDKNGKMYKSKIIKTEGCYSSANVFTIRDLVGSMIESGTIEDMLGKNYVESIFKKTYISHYDQAECNISLQESEPFVIQMKAYLQQQNKGEIEKFIEIVKGKLATSLDLKKDSFGANFPHLDSLGEAVIAKLERKYSSN